MRTAQQDLLDELRRRDLNMLEVSKEAEESLERAFAALSLLEIRGVGKPQHQACRLLIELDSPLTMAGSIVAAYKLACDGVPPCTSPCECVANKAAGIRPWGVADG